LIAFLPGAAAAGGYPANLDARNDSTTNSCYGPDYAQTFTAVHSGMLDGVDLYLITPDSADIWVDVTIENVVGGAPDDFNVRSVSGVTLTGRSSQWFRVTFVDPVAVAAGIQYAIKVHLGPGSGHVCGSGVSNYAGGQAWTLAGESWSAMTADMGFRVYVDTTATTAQWNKSSITADESTPISLTFTMTFADTVGSSHIVLLEDVPAWFDVTAMTCSAPIAPADCTRAKLTDTLNQLVVESLTDADTMTVTLTGTATPAAAGTATAKGLGCILFDRGEAGPLDWCQNGTASVSITAAEATAPPATPTPAPTAATATPTPIAATPPPTAAVGSGPTSDGGMTLVLPLLLASLGGLFVLARRRGRSRT
jgi:hypothetical protein